MAGSGGTIGVAGGALEGRPDTLTVESRSNSF